jgi:hypothetical protein
MISSAMADPVQSSETDSPLDPEAIDQEVAGEHALFKLTQLGFKLCSNTGQHRLIRLVDSSQAHLYDITNNENSRQGIFGSVGTVPRVIAAVQALLLAEAILADEDFRRTYLPKWQHPLSNQNRTVKRKTGK